MLKIIEKYKQWRCGAHYRNCVFKAFKIDLRNRIKIRIIVLINRLQRGKMIYGLQRKKKDMNEIRKALKRLK